VHGQGDHGPTGPLPTRVAAFAFSAGFSRLVVVTCTNSHESHRGDKRIGIPMWDLPNGHLIRAGYDYTRID
jgi:hypothetical protein